MNIPPAASQLSFKSMRSSIKTLKRWLKRQDHNNSSIEAYIQCDTTMTIGHKNSIFANLRSSSAFAMLVETPTGNDIGGILSWAIAIDTFVRATFAIRRHVHVMGILQLQFSLAPIVLVNARGLNVGHARQNVGLQVLDGPPQASAVLFPFQLLEPMGDAGNIRPHGVLVQIGCSSLQ
jgi:hypothetical protein